MMTPFRLALKSFGRESTKGVLFSVALAAMLISAVLNIATSLQMTLYNEAVAQSTNAHGKLRNSAEYMEKVKAFPDVEWAEVISYFPYACQIEGDDKKIGLASLRDMDKGYVEGLRLTKGSAPQNESEAAVSPQMAKILGIDGEIGDRFTLYYDDELGGKGEIHLTVTGILEDQFFMVSNGSYNVLVSEGQILKNPLSTQDIMLHIKDGFDPAEQVKKIADDLGIEREQMEINDGYINMSKPDPVTMGTVGAIILLLLVTGGLVIYNAFYIMVTKRIHNYGMLTLVGASKRQVRRCIYLEGLLYCAAAVPGGLILGTILSFVSLPLVEGSMRGGGSDLSIWFSVSPLSYVLSFLLTVLMVFIGVRAPAKKASSVSPVEAVKFSQAGSFKPRESRDSIGIKDLAELNMKRSKGRTAVTIATLCISGTLFMLVATCAGFMLGSIDAMVAARVGGDVQIAKGEENEDGGITYKQDDDPLTPAVIEQIEGLKGVERTEATYYSDYFLQANPEQGSVITAVADSVYAKMLKTAGVKGENNTCLSYDSGVAYGNEYLPGQSIDISSGNKNFTLKIGGVIKDVPATGLIRGGGAPILYISHSMMKALGIEGRCEALGVYAGDAMEQEVTTAVEGFIKATGGMRTNSRIAQKEEMLRQLLSMIAIILAIVAVVALVGILNLVSSTLVGVRQRGREFGVLRAIGLSTSGIFKLLRHESLFIFLVSTGASAALGIGGGYLVYLTTAVGGGDMSFSFPWLPLLGLCLVFGLVPLITVKIAAGRLKKITITELLGQEI